MKNRGYNAKRKEKLMEIFLVSVTLSLILLLLLLCFSVIDLSGSASPADSTGGKSGFEAYLPDSLGGFIGVLVGFGAEFLFIEKIKDSKKYRTLVKLLNIDFDNYLLQIDRENGAEKVEPRFAVLKDIVDEADNLSLFDKKERGDILFALMQIYYLSTEINKKGSLDKQAIKALKAKLLTHIIEFRCLTQTGELDSRAKFRYKFISIVLNQEKKYTINLQNDSYRFEIYENGKTGVKTSKNLFDYADNTDEAKHAIKYCQNRLDNIFK